MKSFHEASFLAFPMLFPRSKCKGDINVMQVQELRREKRIRGRNRGVS